MSFKFKCPQCGSSNFGSELQEGTHEILSRHCNGYTAEGRTCGFNWDPKDDAKYGLTPIDTTEALGSTTLFDHLVFAPGAVTMDSFIREAMALPTEELKKKHDPDKCEEPECLLCGIIACPKKEPLHFHHDGCPACE